MLEETKTQAETRLTIVFLIIYYNILVPPPLIFDVHLICKISATVWSQM